MAATITASVSKITARRALAEVTVGPDMKTTGYRTYTADSGTTTTAVIGGLSGIGSDYVTALPWAVNNTDTSVPFEFRRAIELSGTTVTFANAYGAAIATSDELDFFPYRPSLYTQALNRACATVWPRIYRYVTSHIITNSARGERGSIYAIPRNMREVSRVNLWGSLYLRDVFDRADVTGGAGNGWTGTAYGISSEELYSSSDTDADKATRTEKIKDGVIEFTVRGTLAHNATYRTIGLMFRHAEDHSGALDANNYLYVRLLSATTAASGGVVDLRKVDAGTESSLTTGSLTTTNGVNYVVKVEFVGARVRVWVDDIQLIDYALTGLNAKYIDNDRWGFRLDKAGSPGTAARVDNVYAFLTSSPIPWTNWRQNRDTETIDMAAFSGDEPSGILSVEGSEMLSLFAADSAQALVNDTTNVLEMSTSSPEWQTFITAAAAELYLLLGYQAHEAQTRAALERMPGMPRVSGPARGPQM